jgi:hypothetical protein
MLPVHDARARMTTLPVARLGGARCHRRIVAAAAGRAVPDVAHGTAAWTGAAAGAAAGADDAGSGDGAAGAAAAGASLAGVAAGSWMPRRGSLLRENFSAVVARYMTPSGETPATVPLPRRAVH